jgi:HK97 gp10 family phage protein
MSVEITTNGDIVKAVNEGLEKGTLEMAIMMTGQAKNFAPVDKGELRGSIQYKNVNMAGGRTEGRPTDEQPKSPDAVVSATAPHAIYVEKGTKNAPAQPYLEPAAQVASGTSASQVMKDLQQKAVDEETRLGKKTKKASK